jgi:hypothetical protein
MGLSVAAGFNAWATVLVFGGCARIFPEFLHGSVAQFIATSPVLTLAFGLFVAEFFADKIPHLEHFWNFAHTFLRPAAGAALAAACVPNHSIAGQFGVALLGVAVALASHVAKATSRLTSTAAVSGLSQMAVSLAEDVIAVSIAAVAIFSPDLSLGVFLAVLVLMVILHTRVKRAVAILFFLVAHPRRAFRDDS